MCFLAAAIVIAAVILGGSHIIETVIPALISLGSPLVLMGILK